MQLLFNAVSHASTVHPLSHAATSCMSHAATVQHA